MRRIFDFIVLFAIIILLATSANGDDDDDDGDHHHSHDCLGKECEVVKQAIEHIGMHFDTELCHAFRHVHCKNHLLKHDEKVCGTDGHTYHSHCQFAKARCEQILDTHNYHNHRLINPLKVARHGACVHTTVSTSTKTTSGPRTMAAITTGRGITSKKAVITTNPTTARPTATSAIPTTAIPTTAIPTTTLPTTTIPTTTIPSNHYILGSVFCQYKAFANCETTLNVICGSDGQYYPNMCEFSKIQCDHPTLKAVSDLSQCTVPL